MRGKLASRDVFYARLSRNGLIGLLVIVVAMTFGMCGYMYFGNMKFDEAFANAAIEVILKHGSTGQVGDGKIFVSTIEQAYRIRDGVKDVNAINEPLVSAN